MAGSKSMTSQATADQVPRLDPFSQRAGVTWRRKDLCVREVLRQHPAQRRKQQPVVRLELRPADIALLYRALRKGREDSKDEPGAADFYYSEMEMRRHDRSAPWPERLVLWLYWLVAGYPQGQ